MTDSKETTLGLDVPIPVSFVGIDLIILLEIRKARLKILYLQAMFLPRRTEILLGDQFLMLFVMYLHAQASNFGLFRGHNLSLPRNLSLHIWSRCNKPPCFVYQDLAWRRLTTRLGFRKLWNWRKWPHGLSIGDSWIIYHGSDGKIPPRITTFQQRWVNTKAFSSIFWYLRITCLPIGLFLKNVPSFSQ